MKLIRPTYPKEVSIGLLALILVVSFFLASQIFATPFKDIDANIYMGMALVGLAVIIMVLVLWEEFLFPIHIKPVDGGMNFRNHRNKLRKQLTIYLAIPAIFTFVFMNYEVNTIRFFIWAAICVVAPLIGKLFSGIRNYNDFLTLTDNFIEYKNNEEVGKFAMKDVAGIHLIKDERNVLHKFEVSLTDGKRVTIDLDEMELEGFYEAIDHYITEHYKSLVK